MRFTHRRDATSLRANLDLTTDSLMRLSRYFLPLLKENPVAALHDTLFWRLGRKNALRHGDWKLIRQSGAWQLFDLAQDIGETTDLAAGEPGRVHELSDLWDRWNAGQIEALWK